MCYIFSYWIPPVSLTTSMKVVWLLVIVAVGTSIAAPAPNPAGQDQIQLTPEAEKLLEELVEIAGDHDPDETDRTRRTSKFLDKKKFSLGSISSFHHDEKYDKFHDFEHKAFNLWGLKKAILLSLFQAIKAITGGVIAVKGHLIKGGGKIVEASGKILEHKGAAITDFGKHVAYKALSKPIHLPEISGYGPTGYDHHHHGYGVPPVYGPPSEHHHFYHQPGPTGYDYPSHIHAKSGSASAQPSEQKDKKTLPDGVQAGLIILKPIKDEGGNTGAPAHAPPHSAPSTHHNAPHNAPSAPSGGYHQDNGYYKFTSSGQNNDGYYKFDPIGEYSDHSAFTQTIQPNSETFFSQSVPSYYDKPSISRSIEYSYFVPQY